MVIFIKNKSDKFFVEYGYFLAYKARLSTLGDKDNNRPNGV